MKLGSCSRLYALRVGTPADAGAEHTGAGGEDGENELKTLFKERGTA